MARSARPLPIRAVPANVALTLARLNPVALTLARLIRVRLTLVPLILARLILVQLTPVPLIPGSMLRRTPAVAGSGPERPASRMGSGRRARTVRTIVP